MAVAPSNTFCSNPSTSISVIEVESHIDQGDVVITIQNQGERFKSEEGADFFAKFTRIGADMVPFYCGKIFHQITIFAEIVPILAELNSTESTVINNIGT